MYVTLAAADLSWVMIALHLALMFGLVVLSGAFSASETVLFSLSRTQLEQAAASHSPFRRLVARVMQQPKYTLMTILLGNTAVNVLLFATAYVFFHRLAARAGPWVAPLAGSASVLLVLIGGEVTPKVLAVRFAEPLAPLAAVFVRAVSYVLGPIGRVLDLLLVEPFVRVVLGGAGARRAREHDLSTDELKVLLQMSRRRGDINRIEDLFAREIIDLGSALVRDFMVPRVEVVACDVNAPAEGLRQLMRATRLKKIPVYDGSIDNIVGLVYAKVLFPNPDRPLKHVVRPVHFVPELATSEHLLQHFRQTKTQLAIVVDEYGGMAGLVTLEDLLEEIVGEISTPEDQPEEPEIRPLSDTEYDISGRLDIRYWAESFGLPLLEDRVTTVGGLVTARLGRPAQVGDAIRLSNVELRVTNVQRRRVERLQLRLLEATGGGPEP
jgi:putative hemolysin